MLISYGVLWAAEQRKVHDLLCRINHCFLKTVQEHLSLSHSIECCQLFLII